MSTIRSNCLFATIGLCLILSIEVGFAQAPDAIGGGETTPSPASGAAVQSAFDITVDTDSGETYVAQIGGETEVCRRDDAEIVATNDDERERCRQLLPGCSIFVVGAQRDPEELEETAEKNLAVLRRFRYIRDQRSLAAGFELDVSACGHFANKGSFSLLPLLIPPIILVPLLPISP